MIDEPSPPPSRTHVVSALADLLVNAVPDRVLRVAIDGPDAAVRARYLPAQGALPDLCRTPGTRRRADRQRGSGQPARSALARMNRP
ncbi:hypothetical protein [Frankia tisae]|uniref:hypothetical protein n=1 Tax=Frankia tisae TaxID=2950104 RepID=UPI0021BF61A3|nr:hypothetical protein [Frankia tisae]